MAPPVSIKSLRESLPGCHALAYVDMEARLVLLSDAQVPLPQEAFDGLCLRARLALGDPAARAACDLFGAAAPPAEATLFRDGAWEVFVRGSVCPDEALCALLAAEAAPDLALHHLRAAVDDFAEDAGMASADLRE